MYQNLRDRLRGDLVHVHDRLDAQVSRFDLCTVEGLRGFLAMNVSALSALLPMNASAHTYSAAQDVLDRAKKDLVQLGGLVPASPHLAPIKVHELAFDYIFAGSRLGTRVLRKRWANSGNVTALAADRYFSAPSHVDLWQDFCDRAQTHPAVGDLSDTVVADARTVFDVYQKCATAILNQKDGHDGAARARRYVANG